MRNIIQTSITDLPKNPREDDKFGINDYERGLLLFIENTSTPITIALQGEWGSGKTSLMNSLQLNLDNEKSKFHSIWLNTWEYALMKNAQSTLIDIISGLINEISKIAKIDETKTRKLLNTLWTGVKETTKVVAKNALDKTMSGSGQIIDSFSSNEKSNISVIRNELESIIDKCIVKDNKKGIIFFIDDLDRIDPPVAVQLLELLKNIFTLRNCVFVLAIDYDVIVKGLEPKFGKRNENNEREFRSFFDKLIQVPFTMPVTKYVINNFIKESLLTINYLNSKQTNNDELIEKITQFSSLTVGSNPRALKRLINSLSLISCINNTKYKTANNSLDTELKLIVNFVLVGIQIAYPVFYNLLSRYPNFVKWDEKVARQYNLKEIDKETSLKLKDTEEFDETWEKIVYRVCEKDYHLKKNSLNISILLNSLKELIGDNKQNVESIISSVISLSSVTSVEENKKNDGSYSQRYSDLNESSRIEEKLTILKDQLLSTSSIISNYKLEVDITPRDPKINIIVNDIYLQVYAGFESRNKVKLIFKANNNFKETTKDSLVRIAKKLNLEIKKPKSKYASYCLTDKMNETISISEYKMIADKIVKTIDLVK